MPPYSTRKHDVLNISMTFVFRLGRKHPGVPSNQTFIRLFKIEEGKPEPVYRTRGRSSDAVVNHQPTPRRFNGRRRHSNLVGIPPSASPGFQHELVIPPMPQIRRVGDPDVSS